MRVTTRDLAPFGNVFIEHEFRRVAEFRQIVANGNEAAARLSFTRP